MTTLFTRSLKNKLIQLLLFVSLPLLSQAQTVIVNYDFNNASAYPVAPAATAAGVTAVATSTEGFVANAVGTPSGPSAFAANATGPALAMNNSSGSNTKYFQFALDGASLPKYSAFKIYLQGYRSNTGATTLALQYSVNGGAYATFPATYAPGNTVYAEGAFDLSGLTVLNSPASLVFRLLASGASGTGTLRVDNFQVQAVNTVDPVVSTLAPTTMEAGSPEFVLTVGGSNFTSGAVVSFNGQALATAYNSPTSLTATVPAAVTATAGSCNVTVANPTAGSSTSLPATFTVTPALLRWTGGGNSTSWFNPANWSTNAVPGTNDDVLLDHRYVAGTFTVSLDQNVAVSIKSLTVNPGAGDSIFALVPAANTVSPTALTIGNTTAASALAIYNKGVVTNASSAATGSFGIDIAGTNPTAFIYNGGSYRHASSCRHAVVVENLSGAAGTELGMFDFRLPTTGSNSTSLSLSGRTYGTLILRNRPNQTATTFTGAGTALTIQGNLLIGPGVTFAPAINNDLRVLGDIRVQGAFQFKETTPISPTSQVVLAGTKPQTISGTFQLSGGVGLAINNPAGATLATAVSVGGPLTLTSGTLTTTSANLLMLSSTASVGGSPTSYVNGPLARQTNAGALTNLVFPTGSGTSYRPVTLNATAQDATTYLVTQAEGPAPDYTNLPASTSALPMLTRVSRARSYTITPTPAANNFSGTVTLTFGPDDQVSAPNDPSLVIGKNSGSGWQNIGNSMVNVATTPPTGGYASGTITSGTFTSFSDFALASTSADAATNPLPVTLTSFAARRQAADVRLSWATASELRNARFEVQRSLDGQLFTTVATVAGQGTTMQANQYFALDPTAPTAILYYRLAQVDVDGRTTFSPVVVLAGTTAAVLYPNPARDRLVVPAPAGTQVRVLDLTGRVLQTVFLPPSGEVSVTSLPAGTYLLQLSEGAQTLRFSKE